MGINIDHSIEEISVDGYEEVDGYLSFEDSGTSTTLKELVESVISRRGYIHGLRITRTSASAIQIATGFCVDDERSFEITVSSPISVALTSSGAGGLDTGSESSNTLYHAFVIADSYGVNNPDGLLSTSFDSPTMPSGYDKKRRVASIRNNGNGDIHFFTHTGEGAHRYMMYEPDDAAGNFDIAIVAAGTATSFTNVDCSSIAPSSSKSFYIAINHLNNNGSPAQTQYRAGTRSDSLYEFYSTAGSGLSVYHHMWIPCKSSGPAFDYKITQNVSPQVNVWLLGYTEDLEEI